MIKKNRLTDKSAADLREDATLVCEARGVPNVTFVWGRVGGQRLATGLKYSMNNRMIDPLTWRSEFTVKNVSTNDYGGYECLARNSEGTTVYTVDLDVKSRPEIPANLRVLNVTHRAVMLEWEPGFHGGMDQYFRLSYTPTDGSDGKKYWDVYPANANTVILSDLHPGIEYSVDVMAINNLGESNYTFEPVTVRTASEFYFFTLCSSP